MTADEVAAFRLALTASLPGFELPVAYGVGVLDDGGGIRFPVVNRGGMHHLPGVVLAAVLGYRSGTCALATTPGQLQDAHDRLAPVEACTVFGHPNLWSWRELLQAVPTGPFVTVFEGPAGTGASGGVLATFAALAGTTD